MENIEKYRIKYIILEKIMDELSLNKNNKTKIDLYNSENMKIIFILISI